MIAQKGNEQNYQIAKLTAADSRTMKAITVLTLTFLPGTMLAVRSIPLAFSKVGSFDHRAGTLGCWYLHTGARQKLEGLSGHNMRPYSARIRVVVFICQNCDKGDFVGWRR
jgi:hypothetical protein